MRDIKFRGKRVNNGEWAYGFYREFSIPDCWKDKAYRDGINYYIDEKETNESHLVIPETVGQYTGLKDKNGKEIYEGDLLRFPPKDDWEKTSYVSYEVFWHDNDCADRHIGW